MAGLIGINGRRSTQLGDSVCNAHALAECEDTNFSLEDVHVEFEENIASDFLLYPNKFNIWEKSSEGMENVPVNLSQTSWSKPFDLSHATTSSIPQSLGCFFSFLSSLKVVRVVGAEVALVEALLETDDVVEVPSWGTPEA